MDITVKSNKKIVQFRGNGESLRIATGDNNTLYVYDGEVFYAWSEFNSFIIYGFGGSLFKSAANALNFIQEELAEPMVSFKPFGKDNFMVTISGWSPYLSYDEKEESQRIDWSCAEPYVRQENSDAVISDLDELKTESRSFAVGEFAYSTWEEHQIVATHGQNTIPAGKVLDVLNAYAKNLNESVLIITLDENDHIVLSLAGWSI